MALDNGGGNGSASSHHPAVTEFLRTIEEVRNGRKVIRRDMRKANNLHAAQSIKQRALRKRLRKCIRTAESDAPPESSEDANELEELDADDLEELDDLDDITVDELIPYRPILDSSLDAS